MRKLSHLNEETITNLILPNIEINHSESFDYSMFPTSKYDNFIYNKLINQCINYELTKNYQLKAYSHVNFCIKYSDKTIQPDVWDAIFLFISMWIFKLVVAGSYYDFRLKRHIKDKTTNNEEYYAKPVKSKLKQSVLNFSLMRNWYKFIKRPKSDEFNSISTIKFLLTSTVISGHINAIFKGFPSDNTYFIEESSFSIWAPLFMNSHITIQSFLTAAAFMIGYQFYEFQKSEKFNIHYLWKACVYRILR